MMEIFKTQREFNLKFPSKIYVCPNCLTLSDNPYICANCGNQSNNIFLKNYKYKIEQKGEVETIFPPIELKGISNEKLASN